MRSADGEGFLCLLIACHVTRHGRFRAVSSPRCHSSKAQRQPAGLPPVPLTPTGPELCLAVSSSGSSPRRLAVTMASQGLVIPSVYQRLPEMHTILTSPHFGRSRRLFISALGPRPCSSAFPRGYHSHACLLP